MFDSFSYYGSMALAVYKALALVVTIVAVLGIAYIAKKSSEIKKMKQDSVTLSATKGLHVESDTIQTGKGNNKSLIRENTIARLQSVIERLDKQEIKDFKSAIIEVDALVDVILRAEGFLGETMADRMRSIPQGRLSNREEFWKAHKVRNNIAHDPHYVVSSREGHDIMKIYKRILEELGML